MKQPLLMVFLIFIILGYNFCQNKGSRVPLSFNQINAENKLILEKHHYFKNCSNDESHNNQCWRVEINEVNPELHYKDLTLIITPKSSSQSFLSFLTDVEKLHQFAFTKPESILKCLSQDKIEANCIRLGHFYAGREKDIQTKLLSLLADENMNPDLRLMNLGFFIERKSQDAVPVLISITSRKHPQFLASVLYGLKEIGGEKAIQFIKEAQFHPLPEIQNIAKELLKSENN